MAAEGHTAKGISGETEREVCVCVCLRVPSCSDAGTPTALLSPGVVKID